MTRSSLYIGSACSKIVSDTAAAMDYFIELSDHGQRFRVPAIPSGEIGQPWLQREARAILAAPAVFGSEGSFAHKPDYRRGPKGMVMPGRRLTAAMLDFGIAEQTAADYAVLQHISRERCIPTPAVQVGVRTLDAGILTLPLNIWQRSTLSAILEATARDLEQARHNTTNNMFCLFELPVATIAANVTRNFYPVMNRLADATVELIEAVDTPYALHFCHGDLDNSSPGDHGAVAERMGLRHVLYDLRQTTAWATMLLHRLERAGLLDKLWGVHIPLSLAKRPPALELYAYEKAFRDFIVPDGIEIIIGCLHSDREVGDIRRLIDYFDHFFGTPVGIAPMCGWGRKDEAKAKAEAAQLVQLTEPALN